MSQPLSDAAIDLDMDGTSDFSPEISGARDVAELGDVDDGFSLDTTATGVKNLSQIDVDSFNIDTNMPIASEVPYLTESQDPKKRKSATPASNGPATPTTPSYDPAMLLNPKAAKRQRTDNDISDGAEAQPLDGDEPAHNIYSSMIDRIHGVKHRDGSQLGGHGRKPKVPNDQSDETKDDRAPSAKFIGKSGGDLAQAVKDKKAEGQKEAIAAGVVTSTIDLTGDNDTCDDDDEVQITGEVKRVEVCLGKVEHTNINADVVPFPRGNFTGSATQWPMIPIRLSTAIGDSPLNIRARDGRDQRFGRVEGRTARWLAPLMNPQSVMQVRPVARIEARRKMHQNEKSGAAASYSIGLTLHLYSRRDQADAIGDFLKRNDVRLKRPTFVEKDREIYNPHEPVQKSHPIPSGSGFSGGSIGISSHNTIQRTAEEIRDEVVGVFDKLTKDEDMPEKDAPSTVLTPLLSHQKQALWFMSDRERLRTINEDDSDNVSLWRRKTGRNGKLSYYSVVTSHEYSDPPVLTKGGILADVMGLGKTLDVLSLIMSTQDEARHFARQPPPTDLINVKGTLLVCPMSTTANWEEQIRQHIKDRSISIYIYHGDKRTNDSEFLAQFDIVITTFGTLSADYKKTTTRPLQEVNWFRVVLDEAHMIRTQNTGQNLAACALSADRRWAVTGTPVQNRLEDLGALIKFLRIAPIDDKGRFQHFVLTPFKNGDHSVVHKLQLLVNSITIRRLKDRIDLPARKDHYVRLDFTEQERKVYDLFAKDGANRIAAMTSGNKEKLAGKAYIHVLQAILRLRQICAHGQDLLNDEDHKMMEGMSANKPISIDDDDASGDEAEITIGAHQAYDGFKLARDADTDFCSLCSNRLISTQVRDNDSSESDSSSDEAVGPTIGFMGPCYQIACAKCFPAYEKKLQAEREKQAGEKLVKCDLCQAFHRMSFFKLTVEGLREAEEGRSRVTRDDKLSRMLARYNGPGTKVIALLEDLEKNRQESLSLPEGEPPIKSVVFSGWTSNLDLIEMGLRRNNITFNRLDGTMSRTKRAAALTTFSSDPTVTVMLVSISAGGLGLNLTAANKAYVMEPQFNPAAEAQAVDRVHRLGQKREVQITRYIMHKSFEQDMLNLQDKKRKLAKMVTGRKLSREEELKQTLTDLRSLFR